MLKKLFSLNNRAWSASFFNVVAMFLQFWAIWSTRNSGGVSLGMMAIFLYVQITYAQVGYRDKSWALFWGMILSACFTVSVIVLTIVLRGVHL